MKLLLLDTATNMFSMAIGDGQNILAESCAIGGANTAARLQPVLDQLLKESGITLQDLDTLAVTVGPGSFTGLRVGMAFVKGLALALGRQVVPLSSLELLAMNGSGSNIPVCAMYDARKGEIYGAVFEFSGGISTVVAETVATVESFLTQISAKCLFIGDGALRYRQEIQQQLGDQAVFAESDLDTPRAAAGLPYATSLFSSGHAIPAALLLPRYLRLSEAEIAKASRAA